MPEYQDEAGKTRWTRIVYVIELSPNACADRKSPCDGACGKTPVYVGQTAKSAEDRFAEHKTGHKSSKWVKRYGVRERPDLVGEYGEMGTVSESVAAEAEHAAALASTGLYCVYGGH